MNADTPGKRLYLIRLACGDGVRSAESLKAFARRVLRETGAVYHANALSLLERDEQGWLVQDVETLWRVDPDKRGNVWLAFGDRKRGAATASELAAERLDAEAVAENQRRLAAGEGPIATAEARDGAEDASHDTAAKAKRKRRRRPPDGK